MNNRKLKKYHLHNFRFEINKSLRKMEETIVFGLKTLHYQDELTDLPVRFILPRTQTLAAMPRNNCSKHQVAEDGSKMVVKLIDSQTASSSSSTEDLSTDQGQSTLVHQHLTKKNIFDPISTLGGNRNHFYNNLTMCADCTATDNAVYYVRGENSIASNGLRFLDRKTSTAKWPENTLQDVYHQGKTNCSATLHHHRLIHSTGTLSDYRNLYSCLPNSELKRVNVSRSSLTVILSAIYAIFLITVGVVIGVADLMVPNTKIGEVFGIYLVILGLIWYLFLHIDLLRHNRLVKNRITYEADNAEQHPRTECKRKIEKRETVNRNLNIGLWKWQTEEMTVNYMFDRGRHSGNFFLKIGAAGFCFGHLIHSCLTLAQKILLFSSQDWILQEECTDVTVLVFYVLFPIHSFYQLYILFKYSSVIINRFKELARFALMHSLATNIFFWFSMILRETMDGLNGTTVQHQNESTIAHNQTMASLPLLLNLTGDSDEYEALMHLWNGMTYQSDNCQIASEFSALILRVSPYLYPFSIEYSIIVVGILFIMWQNIGKVENCCNKLEDNDQETGDWTGNALRNNLVLHADCHSASRGLFAGLLVLVATVVSIIIFFLAFTNDEYVETGIWVNLVSETSLLVLMVIAVILAYRQLSRLNINPNSTSLLDDLLLFICIPCFFLYGIFSIVPAMAYSNYMAIIVIVLQVVQVILQTPFIIDGLRRCSNNPFLRETKPGRELITFLIVCNIAMWIIETLEIKSYETNIEQVEFYGYPLWTFLSHVTLPLTLFYRFHSSACLVDIWKSAYEHGE